MAGHPSALKGPVSPHITVVTLTSGAPANGTVSVPMCGGVIGSVGDTTRSMPSSCIFCSIRVW